MNAAVTQLALTQDDLKVLTAPFPADAHEFLNGLAYLTESAITTRLEQVDPAWQFFITNLIQRGNTVTVTARLEVKGVIREGTGMAQIQTSKDGNREVNEAEKSATTDALKRAARLYGVGRYLLTLPDKVKDITSLAAWLKEQSGGNPPSGNASQHGSGNGKPAADGIDLSKPPVWWKSVLDEIVGWKHFDNVKTHATNALNKLIADGTLTHAQTRTEVLLILAHKYANNAELTRQYDDIPF